jgi:spore coat polysaccharide biosynthesis protein SpsF (cytidylyltransferase family)
MGSYIQFNIQLLQEIERKIQNTAGVPPQRLGAISNQELVGNVERSIVQSSLVTEDLFRMHNLTKLDVCEALLEVAKDVYKDGSKTLQFVTDDLQTILFQVDGEEFNNADYGVYVTDDNKDMEVFQAMREHMKFALQNDQMAFHQIADIYTMESVSEMRATLKQYYDEKMQQQQQAQQQQSQMQQQQIAAQQQMHQEDMELKKYINDSTNQTKIQVAEIGVYSRQQELDLNEDDIPDPIQLADQALRQQEAMSKDFVERMKLEADKVKAASETSMKQKEFSIKEKEIQSREKVEKMKADTALKIANFEANLKSECEHVTPFIWKNPKRFKIQNFKFERNLSSWRWTVDKQEDLDFFRCIFKEFKNKPLVNYREVIKFLETNPEIMKINSGTIRNEGYIKSLIQES